MRTSDWQTGSWLRPRGDFLRLGNSPEFVPSYFPIKHFILDDPLPGRACGQRADGQPNQDVLGICKHFHPAPLEVFSFCDQQIVQPKEVTAASGRRCKQTGVQESSHA